MRFVHAGLIVGALTCAGLKATCGGPIAGPVSATVLRVIDGDTFEARAEVWPDIEVTVAVRLAGIDAPELHAPCLRERALAMAARDLLTRALPPQSPVRLTQVAHDKYAGRVIAQAWLADGRAAGPLLLAAGLAAVYGERRDWCGS
jgi:endonuclease YncB( thermonuclease family)